jgi:hypothetical protein
MLVLVAETFCIELLWTREIHGIVYYITDEEDLEITTTGIKKIIILAYFNTLTTILTIGTVN